MASRRKTAVIDERRDRAMEKANTCPAAPVVVDTEDRLDWDVWLETPPARPSGVITVRLIDGGRDTPPIVSDPETPEDGGE
jgi:hypothetical protein